MSPEDRRAQIIDEARALFVELGYGGARIHDIAVRAGITDAFIYYHFDSKRELYHAAIREPIEVLIHDLVEESNAMSSRHATHQEILRHFHELMLRYMTDIGPLLGVALLSDKLDAKELYNEFVLPKFSAAIGSILAELTGWHDQEVDLEVLVEATFGVHLGIALWRLLAPGPENQRSMARQLGTLFGGGIPLGSPPGFEVPAASAPRAKAGRRAKAKALPAAAGEQGDPGSVEAFRAKMTQMLHGPAAPAEAAAPAGPEVRRRRMSEDARRASILRAAREVFVAAGVKEARTKDIASTAGITEAFMFRVFRSKDELYQEAVEGPAGAVWQLLTVEIETVAKDPTLTGPEILLRVNERILVALVEVAPLLGVVLFSDIDRGKRFVEMVASTRSSPFRRIQKVISQAAGWKPPAITSEVAMKAIMGVHLGLALDAMLREREIDIPETARCITAMLIAGVRADGDRETASLA
ncbi:TetR/AcrR family transcriptional regulator [Sporichthya sp.]|uniref:TetR/AcrR family transcriptional regulator n=1 Tax=Sporichthya sp. TaxID=65475 RepID=UPI001798B627|nr:TetR/AcrR family transcriptional regulator [Sporichthya sp.]MBA3741484.1 TetR/AcrR family transcriptional regulator [Sporichthya sp.]